MQNFCHLGHRAEISHAGAKIETVPFVHMVNYKMADGSDSHETHNSDGYMSCAHCETPSEVCNSSPPNTKTRRCSFCEEWKDIFPWVDQVRPLY